MTGPSETLFQRLAFSFREVMADIRSNGFSCQTVYKHVRPYLSLKTCVRLERLATQLSGKSRFSGRVRSPGLNAACVGSTAKGFQTAGMIEGPVLADSLPAGTVNGLVIRPSHQNASHGAASRKIKCSFAEVPWPVSDGYTPRGFNIALTDRFAAISTVSRGRPPQDPNGQPSKLLHVPDLNALKQQPDYWRHRLQRFTGLLDAAGNHHDVRLRAAVLTHAAAVGLPVCLNDDRGLRGFLPDAVLDLWLNTRPADLLVPLQREHAAFRQWHAVFENLSMRSAGNRLLQSRDGAAPHHRKISVLLVTKRPEQIPHWASLLAAQNYPDFEVVAGFHGRKFSRAHEAEAQALLGERLTIIRAPDEMVLGDVLNSVTAAAAGELIVKWDDDDLYSSQHLSDLAAIYEYSGASLVGKALEFIYLAASRTTIRISMRSSERPGYRMAGNTICLAREDLLEVGGWQPLPRSVDTKLVREMQRQGGQLYRGIGFGHMALRSPLTSHGHTWDVPESQLLHYCRDSRPGADAAFALIDAPAELVSRWAKVKPDDERSRQRVA